MPTWSMEFIQTLHNSIQAKRAVSELPAPSRSVITYGKGYGAETDGGLRIGFNDGSHVICLPESKATMCPHFWTGEHHG